MWYWNGVTKTDIVLHTIGTDLSSAGEYLFCFISNGGAKRCATQEIAAALSFVFWKVIEDIWRLGRANGVPKRSEWSNWIARLFIWRWVAEWETAGRYRNWKKKTFFTFFLQTPKTILRNRDICRRQLGFFKVQHWNWIKSINRHRKTRTIMSNHS